MFKITRLMQVFLVSKRLRAASGLVKFQCCIFRICKALQYGATAGKYCKVDPSRYIGSLCKCLLCSGCPQFRGGH